MTKSKVGDRQPDRTEGLVKPKVRWFDGSMYLDIREVVQSAPFQKKLEEVEQLEKRLRGN